MNSRQTLTSAKGGGVGYIYKPGFVDDDNLEALKMAVDKELSLVSNSFYNTSELLAGISSQLTALSTQVLELEARVAALEADKP